MRNTLEFLDAVKARHQLTSDYQLAKFLGVRQATISGYRNGSRALDETMAMKVAAALALDPAHVLACIAAERAKDEAIKKAWRRAAAATAAAVLGAVALVHLAQLGAGDSALNYSYIAAEGNFTVLTIIRISGFTLILWALAHHARHHGENNDNARPVA